MVSEENGAEFQYSELFIRLPMEQLQPLGLKRLENTNDKYNNDNDAL